ncbi:MAG TPA: hypothetical protein VN690_14260 [Terriglobales bacterium]|nr:hypothetical protein [Terriglobales bacterium]
MATHSIPELNRRLLEERGAAVASAERLRTRIRRELHNLGPREQVKRHPEAALAAAAVLGLVGGRIAGAMLRGLLR